MIEQSLLLINLLFIEKRYFMISLKIGYPMLQRKTVLHLNKGMQIFECGAWVHLTIDNIMNHISTFGVHLTGYCNASYRPLCSCPWVCCEREPWDKPLPYRNKSQKHISYVFWCVGLVCCTVRGVFPAGKRQILTKIKNQTNNLFV